MWQGRCPNCGDLDVEACRNHRPARYDIPEEVAAETLRREQSHLLEALANASEDKVVQITSNGRTRAWISNFRPITAEEE